MGKPLELVNSNRWAKDRIEAIVGEKYSLSTILSPESKVTLRGNAAAGSAHQKFSRLGVILLACYMYLMYRSL